MKNRKEIKLLENQLDELDTTVDHICTFINFTRFFTKIEDLREFLIKEHDISVDEYNFGLKRLNELKGETHGKF